MENFDIFVMGVNHQSATVELREKVVFAPEEIPQALKKIIDPDSLPEAVILSTCNRSEIYLFANTQSNVKQTLIAFFKQHFPALRDSDIERFYFYRGDEAIRHLFSVTSGLNSMVLGEPQIIGQVKGAFRIAFENGATRTYLNRLFNAAFQTTKRIHSETGIGEGAVSVAYAAVELAQKVFKDLSKKNVLLIGAGETGELVVQHLRKRGVESFLVVNRTFDKAEKLAARFGGTAKPFSELLQLVPQSDLIIGSTSAKEFLLTKEHIRNILPARSSRPLFMIDIAVPRDFDPQINQLTNVFLNDIDSLQQIVSQNLKKRRQELPAAKKIILESLHSYQEWRRSLNLTPTIVALREKFELIRNAELKKYRHQTDEEEFEKIERITRGIVNKLLHTPMVQLKQYSNGSMNVDGIMRIDVLREIFELENHND